MFYRRRFESHALQKSRQGLRDLLKRHPVFVGLLVYRIQEASLAVRPNDAMVIPVVVVGTLLSPVSLVSQLESLLVIATTFRRAMRFSFPFRLCRIQISPNGFWMTVMLLGELSVNLIQARSSFRSVETVRDPLIQEL